MKPTYEAEGTRELAALDNNFIYHPPKPGQNERYQFLRNEGWRLSQAVLEQCPSSRERSLALTKIEEAIFWANAAIARNE